MHVLDFLIAIVSLCLEIAFENQPEGGLLIIARMWRFARISYGGMYYVTYTNVLYSYIIIYTINVIYFGVLFMLLHCNCYHILVHLMYNKSYTIL
jgi:hypothetical protein